MTHPYESYSAYTNRDLALAAARDPEDVELLNEILDRLDLDPDETEQGLTPAAAQEVEQWISEWSETEPW